MPDIRSIERSLLLDFDGTVALTFETSPNGVGVHAAYEHAVASLFGRKGLQCFTAEGGLKNRSPREVVVALQADGFKQSDGTSCLTDELVRLKIECLISEIGLPLPEGGIWPRLTQGFKPFWKSVKEDQFVYTAIISSGHQAFIQRTFEVHELELPDHLLTDDELRNREVPLAKPDPMLLCALAQMAGFNPPNPVYVGDDENKDGQFAANCGMPFFRFVPSDSTYLGRDGMFDHWGQFEGLRQP
jgi:hypothetical protein